MDCAATVTSLTDYITLRFSLTWFSVSRGLPNSCQVCCGSPSGSLASLFSCFSKLHDDGCGFSFGLRPNGVSLALFSLFPGCTFDRCFNVAQAVLLELLFTNESAPQCEAIAVQPPTISSLANSPVNWTQIKFSLVYDRIRQFNDFSFILYHLLVRECFILFC